MCKQYLQLASSTPIPTSTPTTPRHPFVPKINVVSHIALIYSYEQDPYWEGWLGTNALNHTENCFYVIECDIKYEYLPTLNIVGSLNISNA